MAYRGRLIFPVDVEIAPLDTEATAADPDEAGGHATGYDPDFKEPVPLVPGGDGTGPGVVNRVEGTPYRLPCQVEVPKWNEMLAASNGNLPQTQLVTVHHFADIESLGLLDAVTNEALIRVGDRLIGFYDTATGALLQAPRTPLYATRVESRSFGLSSLSRNLLVVTWDVRDKGLAVQPT
jgi:hypothetical protein